MESKRNQFEEFVLFRALSHKYDDSGHITDKLLEEGVASGDLTIRNVCAKVSSTLVDRLDEVCGFLHVSKREFVERALIDALDRASVVMEPVIDDLVAMTKEREDRDSKVGRAL